MRHMVTPGGLAPTDDQWAYVEGLRRKLHLSKPLLENHCIVTFKTPMKQLDRRQVSQLIDSMKKWATIPAELLRGAGQLDLFEGGS